MTQINIQSLLDSLKESIGIEAAEKAVYEAIKETNMPVKTSYPEDEFSRICEMLKKRGGFIKTIATVAATHAYQNVHFQAELAKEKKEKENLARLNEMLEEKVEERTRQLKDTQVQMLQSAKMAAVGQLSAGVAHEINNPLEGILGYTQLIMNKLEKPDFNSHEISKCKEYLKHVEDEAHRCSKIVEGLLTFSRKSTDEFRPLDIKSVIENTLSILRRQLEISRVNLKVDYEREIPLIRGNANKLQQVFTNIIINAQQAMPNGGDLNINVQVVSQGDERKIQIDFQDTGCGIPKASLERIFEPFFTTKQDWKSVGLGLYICYQIIQEHNGTILVESRQDKGTTFSILLPV